MSVDNSFVYTGLITGNFQNVMNPETTQGGDTYSYRGWLNSDSFIKRAFAVLGYNFVAGILLYIPLMLGLFLLFGGTSMGIVPMQANDTQVITDESTPQPQMETKLNINQICDDSLAYTSFTDVETTDAYLADCKAGKHPEVIEQFKKSLHMEDGTI